MDEAIQQSLADIQNKRIRLDTPQDINRFLLGNVNVAYLSERQLEAEIDIVTKNVEKSQQQLDEEAALLRNAAKRKVEKDALRYHLNFVELTPEGKLIVTNEGFYPRS